jgi:hypothetical protein
MMTMMMPLWILQLVVVVVAFAARRHNTPPKLVCFICNLEKQK